MVGSRGAARVPSFERRIQRDDFSWIQVPGTYRREVPRAAHGSGVIQVPGTFEVPGT